MEYRYPHFKRELIREDSAFTTGPAPGQKMIEFELVTTDGAKIRSVDLRGHLLTFGSFT